MTQLCWLRSDLRIADQPALAAAQAAGPVVAVFVCCPGQWQEHDWAPCRVAYLLSQLAALGKGLDALGIPLLVRECSTFTQVPALMKTLCQELQIRGVHVGSEWEVNELARDAAVEQTLAQQGISFTRHLDQTVFAPDSLSTGSGGPFQVFTPFKKRWLQRLVEQGFTLAPTIKNQRPQGLGSDPIPQTLRGYAKASFHPAWLVGERALQKQLSEAVEGRLRRYRDRRDFPALDGTSRLSPALALGVLSPRQCLAAALAAQGGQPGADPHLDTWISELIWREFYRHILFHHPRVCRNRAFQRYTERVTWRTDPAGLAAWQEGRTGIPLVDAGMRQLAATGWMHNRVRMVVAQFLSKNLLIDWRQGERHFMRSLIDGDFAQNNGGWQWAASTGTDAAPYFRVFNPLSQSKRFDPEAKYIGKWVPELAQLPAEDRHEPSSEQRKACAYPEPIVDLGSSRQRAIAAFAAVRG